MERVGLLDGGGELLGRGVGDVHLLRLPHRRAVGLRHGGDRGGVRQPLEQAAAQDVVELVAVHPHRLQVHRAAPGLRLQVVERGDDLRAAGAVGRGEVGDHHADVAQLVAAHGDQQVGERRGGDRGQIGVADAPGRRVDEVGRQLVEHDEQGSALQQVDPGALSGSGQRRVVVVEPLPLAELLGDGAPDAERRVALAAREGDHAHRPERGVRRVEAAHHLGPILRMPGQQSEGQQVVRLAAAHRLGELEHPLGRLPLQPAEALGEQRAHALGEVVLGKELARIDAPVDQIGQVEHRVAPARIEDAGPGRARLLDGLRADCVLLTHRRHIDHRSAPAVKRPDGAPVSYGRADLICFLEGVTSREPPDYRTVAGRPCGGVGCCRQGAQPKPNRSCSAGDRAIPGGL